MCKPSHVPMAKLCCACTPHVWGEARSCMLGVPCHRLSNCSLGHCCCWHPWTGPYCGPVLSPHGHCSLVVLLSQAIGFFKEIHFYRTWRTLWSCGWVHVLHLWYYCSSEWSAPAWERMWGPRRAGMGEGWETASSCAGASDLTPRVCTHFGCLCKAVNSTSTVPWHAMCLRHF